MSTDKLLISVEEAAQLLDVGRSTVYDLLRTRAIPSVRIGRCRRIPVTGLRAYIADLESQGWLDNDPALEYRRGA